MTSITKKIIMGVGILLGGALLTATSIWTPVDGPLIGSMNGCGTPTGFPFAYMGTWKNLEGPFYPLCAVGISYVSLVLNVIVWSVVLSALAMLLKRVTIKMYGSKKTN